MQLWMGGIAPLPSEGRSMTPLCLVWTKVPDAKRTQSNMRSGTGGVAALTIDRYARVSIDGQTLDAQGGGEGGSGAKTGRSGVSSSSGGPGERGRADGPKARSSRKINQGPSKRPSDHL
jgi:hypothetical protein